MKSATDVRIAPGVRGGNNPIAMALGVAKLYGIMRPILFRLDPERAHRIMLALAALAPPSAPESDPPELRSTLFGFRFENPVGLAAGLDKDARALFTWNRLGFGFAEIGTVTPRPQPGNPPPRMWRLAEERALINRLGFPSEGVEAVQRRIHAARRRGLRIRLGLNLGPNRQTAAERVAGDYAALSAALSSLADFIVVNVSSPNTPGLRGWQAPERIRAIVEAIRSHCETASRRPLLVKLAPDLEPAVLRGICDALVEVGVDGVVATNTTVARRELGIAAGFEGGLSGAPLLERAREVIARIHENTLGRIPIIGVGGIFSADDAWGHIRAGASLVELYTGLIYRGPALVSEIKTGLLRLLRSSGFRSISEAVGSAFESRAGGAAAR